MNTAKGFSQGFVRHSNEIWRVTTIAHAGAFPGASAHAFAPHLASELTIDGGDGHHLARVRRLRIGEIVTIANGQGAWRGYEILQNTRDALTVRSTTAEISEPPTRTQVTIAPALIAKNRFDDMIVALVELGVTGIIPFAAERSVVQWQGTKAAEAHKRLERLVREASMQCRRSYLPTVFPLANASQLAIHNNIAIAAFDGTRPNKIDRSLIDISDWLVVSGPEGGLSETDIAALDSRRPATRICLGPHVLRAETAPLAAVAVLNSL